MGGGISGHPATPSRASPNCQLVSQSVSSVPAAVWRESCAVWELATKFMRHRAQIELRVLGQRADLHRGGRDGRGTPSSGPPPLFGAHTVRRPGPGRASLMLSPPAVAFREQPQTRGEGDEQASETQRHCPAQPPGPTSAPKVSVNFVPGKSRNNLR